MLRCAFLLGLVWPATVALAPLSAPLNRPLPSPMPAPDPTPAVTSVAAPAVAAANWTLDELFAALRVVETGGSPDEGRRARGDRGAAIGPYQIHRAYWQDARVAGRYEQCLDPDYARTVMLAYWRRYCPRALADVDAEVLARVHNGGPKGHTKASTRDFWSKVERELRRAQAEASRRLPTT